MRLTRLEIQNYKSLRKIAVESTPLMALVGPNASGKTNFADALDFLGLTYRLGLEPAVAAKGGYENICYRAARRSQSPIRIQLRMSLPKSESSEYLHHSFEFRALRKTEAQFSISGESFEYGTGPGQPLFAMDRNRGLLFPKDFLAREFAILFPHEEEVPKNLGHYAPPFFPGGRMAIADTHLVLAAAQRIFSFLEIFSRALGSLRVFQLNPRTCRGTGVPTPNAELDRFGGNLPAALDHLKKNYPESYAALLETVRKVLPTVESLDTGFTHTKTLALFLRERGFGRPWPAEDISDGTLQTIALLVALFDPRSKIVVIEEPENSIHPWALRTFVEAARQVSTQKQVFLTTHSPVLIDQLRPEELWVVRRPGAETLIDPLPRLDPTVTEAWGQGKFTLSEYLDSGALPDAVPAAGSGR